MKSAWLPLVVLMTLLPRVAEACAACFGRSDSQLAQGMNAGIFALLVFVFGFWALFGSFFIFIARRARRVTPDLPGIQNDPHHN